MNKGNILFVTHRESQCGVYDFGERVFNSLSVSKEYSFIKTICICKEDLLEAVSKYNPLAIIYNYTFITQPWIVSRVCKGFYRNNVYDIKIPQIGIIHEITQSIADEAAKKKKYFFTRLNKIDNSIFDAYISADPTLLLKNQVVFKTGRVIPEFNKQILPPKNFVVSSFGFGTKKKGFENLVKKVQEEFDNAEIKINVPFSEYCDKDGIVAKKYADDCRSFITKSGIKLTFTHDYLSQQQLLEYLASSSLIAFLYEDKMGRGVSSVIDYALAVKRPIAISDSVMFRHILEANPSICINNNSLKNIYLNGVMPLNKYITEWTPEILLWEYERIIDKVLVNKNIESRNQKSRFINFIKILKKVFKIRSNDYIQNFNWLRTTDRLYEDDYKKVIPEFNYSEITSHDNIKYNRILDDAARIEYDKTIKLIIELVPKTMAKKIQRANINQAFIFDTVYRLSKKFSNPKILCVGSYEDTACMALIKCGFNVEEIDPMLNYTLQDFYDKPNTKKGNYDLIFSTSVIEHVEDDEGFVSNINDLLSFGGFFIMTCDYKDSWKKGDLKPPVCARLYTNNDLMNRLPSRMKDCDLLDTPRWFCDEYDFIFDIYQYTFASFVVKKRK